MKALEAINKMISTSSNEEDIDFINVDSIREDFESLEFEMEEFEDNINGWSVDFQYYFNHVEHGKFCLFGSLWYGKFKIIKCDEV